jgi:hypothetical protein
LSLLFHETLYFFRLSVSLAGESLGRRGKSKTAISILSFGSYCKVLKIQSDFNQQTMNSNTNRIQFLYNRRVSNGYFNLPNAHYMLPNDCFNLSSSYSSPCNDYLSLCTRYLNACSSYLVSCSSYLSLSNRYLVSCNGYLSLCNRYLTSCNSYLTSCNRYLMGAICISNFNNENKHKPTR